MKELSDEEHKKLVGELEAKAYNEAWNGEVLVCQGCGKKIRQIEPFKSGPVVHLPTNYDEGCWKLREGEEPFLLCSDCWDDHKKLD